MWPKIQLYLHIQILHIQVKLYNCFFLFISLISPIVVDIDLVQKNAGPIWDIITGLKTALAFLGKPKVKQKVNSCNYRAYPIGSK